MKVLVTVEVVFDLLKLALRGWKVLFFTGTRADVISLH